MAKRIGTFTPDWCRRIMRAVTNFERMKGPGMVNGPAGVAFYPPQAPKQRTQAVRAEIWLKLFGNETGAGMYRAYLMNTAASTDAITVGSAAAEDMLGEADTTSEVVVVNTAEIGKSTHALTAGTPVSKWHRGWKSSRRSDTNLDVYFITAVDTEVCT